MSAKTTTTIPTRDQIEAEAAAAEQRAAALREQMWLADEAERQRRHEAALRFDEQFVASYSRKALDAAVDQALAKLDAVLAEDPVTLALADLSAAMVRRSHLVLEFSSALGRLGRPMPQPEPMPTELSSVDDYMLVTAARIAAERVSAELTELHARRDAADDEG